MNGHRQPAGITVACDQGLVLSPDDEASLLPAVAQAAAAVLEAEGHHGAFLDVTLVGDSVMRGLNGRYRDRAETTDVLAFRGAEAGEPWAEDGGPLGDVVICLDAARRQASAAAASLREELMLLAVHGTLHVVGYDHGTEAEARCMNERTTAILASVGAAPHRRAQAD